jgi:hypothetical protein
MEFLKGIAGQLKIIKKAQFVGDRAFSLVLKARLL